MRAHFDEILTHFRGLAADLASEREEDPARFPYLALDYGIEFMEWMRAWCERTGCTGLERERARELLGNRIDERGGYTDTKILIRARKAT